MSVALHLVDRPATSTLHQILVRTTRGMRSAGVVGAFRNSVTKDRVHVILDGPPADGMPSDGHYGYLAILLQPIGQLLQRPENRSGAAIEAVAGIDACWPVHENSVILSVDGLLSLDPGVPRGYADDSPFRPAITRMTEEEIRNLPSTLMTSIRYRHDSEVFQW